MAFSSNSGDGPMADINIIPLCDVMLVLLIIFMVTAPQLSYPIDIDLPQPSLNPPVNPVDPPPPIRLRIDASGQVYWNDSPTPTSALRNMMQAEVERDPSNQPTLEIDVNEDADYGTLAKVLAEAKNAQMLKIGFVRN
ncbi:MULTISPECIES: biopolymer transporter ExbD [unclassified Luteimonas]|uniref:ExbD/TolR family protein n=1 Tax=unclassified Luteimonas TaxID=2629088 RepID=UPI0015FF3727|nr:MULTISPECIES: biopolymer transporter ExbD [unclassified Luteimonas]MBB1473269.1 biopolymer transporter ExbD [Luteimonas sp. MC1782]MBB6600557.1 biopolymer transporter ExbD [Luteimonas sp. MC1825]MBJ6981937.1 biopolymer transporter ExbD [Luteimonas sp. MC1572]MBJ7575509.1 biopolymer transporter ExbD [Luteimonas sp. MC1828]QOC88211.1 biopolymer transporter ExbD [Luteimonas sp. MC1825]